MFASVHVYKLTIVFFWKFMFCGCLLLEILISTRHLHI